MRPATARVPIPPAAPSPEDQARADWYALLAALFQRPPDAGLLRQIAAATPTERDTALAQAFAALCEACATTDEAAVRSEYDAAFLGVGKPEVFLHGSYYLTGFLHERPLAELRERLARLGLARREDQAQTEDHVGVLCEVMRLLIVGDDRPVADLAEQRDLFSTFIAPCFGPMCDALEESDATRFYRHVGGLARAFFEIERQAFDFDSH